MEIAAREAFDRMRRQWLTLPDPLTGDEFADDVIVETPFAPPGHRIRFEGRQEFLDFANAGRATLPVRFDGCRTTAVHDTSDPRTIVVEYELTGTSTVTGERSGAAFIGVLTVRDDGKIALWREYQNTLAIMNAVRNG